MKTIQLEEFGIEIELTGDGAGSVSSTLHEECPFCREPQCYDNCDESLSADMDLVESEEDIENRKLFNASIDALESLVLAHAVAGIDVTSPEYQEGIRTAIQAYAHQYD